MAFLKRFSFKYWVLRKNLPDKKEEEKTFRMRKKGC